MKNIRLEKIVLYTAIDKNNYDTALDTIVHLLEEQYDLKLLDWENPVEYTITKRKAK